MAAPHRPPDGSRYYTYPHNNGFLPDGRVVYARQNGPEATLFARDLEGGGDEELFAIAAPFHYVWFDVAPDGRIFWNQTDGLHVRDPEASASRVLYRAPGGMTGTDLVSVSPSGDRVVMTIREDTAAPRHWGFAIVDTRTGAELHRQCWPWWTNHFHFCPHDPSWIGFCHEGPTEGITDRVWGWHAEKAPQGVMLFDQLPDPDGVRVCVGHERWCFHAAAALAVAYGVSPHGPRGVYEIWPDGRPARLVSEGDRDWHLDASRDGRRILVDTTGPHDQPGHGWENHGQISDVLLVDWATGRRRHLARSRLGPGQAHPHPVFSPDGRWAIYNECVDAEGEAGSGKTDSRQVRLPED